jgi:hypothetical protein
MCRVAGIQGSGIDLTEGGGGGLEGGLSSGLAQRPVERCVQRIPLFRALALGYTLWA